LNSHYEHLAWFGPSVALAYWNETMGIWVFGLGTLMLTGIAALARGATSSPARFVTTLTFAIGWIFWGGVAGIPWF
jgi:hypothetical protein